MYKEIHLAKAGTLAKLIDEEEKDYTRHLKISGRINAKDFNVLDAMCDTMGEFDDNDDFIMYEDMPPFLEILDLGDCFMEGKAILGEFTYRTKLKEVILPSNLISTGSDCSNTFQDAEFLEKVVFPDTLKEIAYGTFICCSSLKNIVLPQGLECISGLAFSGCESLESVSIPANVSYVGGGAFQYCDKLEKIEIDRDNKHFSTIDGVLFSKDKKCLVAFPSGHRSKNYIVPEGVEKIEDSAFAGSKIEIINFPNSLKEIGYAAFRSCENLQDIVIPDSVLEIEALAFNFCCKLRSVKLPKHLKVLKEQVFSSCDSLERLEVPSSVKIIEERVLSWTSNLETLILNEGLEEIQDGFKYTKIEKIYIPKSVREISPARPILGGSFHNIFFEVHPENPFFCAVEGSLFNKSKTRLIAVFPNNNTEFIVPEGVEIIEDLVFEKLDLERIILPSTLKNIRYRCFEYCRNLKEMVLPQSLEVLDFRAFDECENLEVVKLYAKKPPRLSDPSADCWKFMEDAKKLVLYVPKESVKIYKKTKRWSDIKRIKAL